MGRSKPSSAKKPDVDDEPRQTATEPAAKAKQPFEAMYLQQASKEFADDLEKLRTANDFKGERSVQILVEALKQGTACYSQGEIHRLTRS